MRITTPQNQSVLAGLLFLFFSPGLIADSKQSPAEAEKECLARYETCKEGCPKKPYKIANICHTGCIAQKDQCLVTPIFSPRDQSVYDRGGIGGVSRTIPTGGR